MRSPARVWIALAVAYAAFFGWYTSFGGPLEHDEIARYVDVLTQSGADPERLALLKHFMETDSGDDFAIVNVIELRETPAPAAGVPPGESSEQVLRRYTEPFMREAIKSAAHPVFFGFAAADALDLWGIDGAQHWSSAGLVRYRSRRDLMEQVVFMSGNPIHDYKVAAMAKTIAYPLDPWFQLGDPRLLLGLLFAVIGLALQLRGVRGREKARQGS